MQKIIAFYLYIDGVIPKQRKSKRHQFKLGSIPDSNVPFEPTSEMIKQSRLHIAGMRSHTNAYIFGQPEEIDGEMQSFMMFDPRCRRFKITDTQVELMRER